MNELAEQLIQAMVKHLRSKPDKPFWPPFSTHQLAQEIEDKTEIGVISASRLIVLTIERIGNGEEK